MKVYENKVSCMIYDIWQKLKLYAYCKQYNFKTMS